MSKKLYVGLKDAFIKFIPFAVLITLLCGLIYATSQQVYRQSANDPQIQISQDLSAQLKEGVDPTYFVPPTKTEISQSLAPYIIIFDKDGKLVASSATVRGKEPDLPIGVFANAKILGEERFSWQTSTGERSAVVLKYYKGKGEGFILAGRSLKEIEIREKRLEIMVFLGWIATLVLTYGSIFATKYLIKTI